MYLFAKIDNKFFTSMCILAKFHLFLSKIKSWKLHYHLFTNVVINILILCHSLIATFPNLIYKVSMLDMTIWYDSKIMISYYFVFMYFFKLFCSFSHKYNFEFAHWKLFLSRKQMRDDIICMLMHTFITTSTFHSAFSPMKHNILVVAYLRLHERLLENKIFQHFFHIYE